MKTIIYLKSADLAIQLGLYLLLAGGILFHGDSNKLYYLLLVTWQLSSLLVHGLLQNRLYVSAHRNRVINLVIGTLLLSVLLARADLMLVFFMAVLLVPVLSMYYMIACFDELQILNRKMVVHLRK